MAASTIPPLSVRPCGTRFSNTQKEPNRCRSAPITDPLFRGFGIPNRSTASLVQRAGRDHPLPKFAGSPWRERDLARKGETRVTCHPGKSNTGIEPHPALRSPRRNALSSCRVPSCLSQESTCASLCDVAAGHSRQGHLRVSNAGGSRRSYRNGRASALQRAPPFPRGPQSRLWGGTWLAPVIQRTCWPPPGVSRFRDPKPIS